jgi:hypothetical protein
MMQRERDTMSLFLQSGGMLDRRKKNPQVKVMSFS